MNPYRLAEKMMDPEQGYCPPELAERIRAERAVIDAAKAMYRSELGTIGPAIQAVHQAVAALEQVEASAP